MVNNIMVELLLTAATSPAKTNSLVDCSGGPPSKGWIAQMEEHWYGIPEVSGSSDSSVKSYLSVVQYVARIMTILWLIPQSFHSSLRISFWVSLYARVRLLCYKSLN